MLLGIQMQKRRNFRGPSVEKEISCSCGSSAKLGSRKNYPFGKKSKPVRTNFYRCKGCGKVTIKGPSISFGRR